MRTLWLTLFLAVLVSGCDLFMADNIGHLGEPCADNGHCRDDLLCSPEKRCLAALDGDFDGPENESEADDRDGDSSETDTLDGDAEREPEAESEHDDGSDGDPEPDLDLATETDQDLESDRDPDLDATDSDLADGDIEETDGADADTAETDLADDAEGSDADSADSEEAEVATEDELETDADGTSQGCEEGPCCHNGVEVAIGGACVAGADDLTCTNDLCNPQGNCEHPLKMNLCLIEGACYTFNQTNPANSCQYCFSSIDPLAWQEKTGGTGCNDGDPCTYGDQCGTGAVCKGTTITCTNDADPCGYQRRCNGTSQCAAVYAASTTTCATDNLACTTDHCDGAGACIHTQQSDTCLIDGACYAAGATYLMNPCSGCLPMKNTTGWSDLPLEASCWSDGLACTIDHCRGSDATCLHDRKNDSCLLDGACYADGAVRPDKPCQNCAAAPNGWVNKAPGEACTTLDPHAQGASSCDSSGNCKLTSCEANYFISTSQNYVCTPVVTQVSTGISNHGCALSKTGTAYCWGNSNQYGELGTRSGTVLTKPQALAGQPAKVRQIVADYQFTCLIDDATGALYCLGDNELGQLGNGSTTNTDTPTLVSDLDSGVLSVALGQGFGCAVKTGGSVYCWGDNSYGQLGNGTIVSQKTPVAVSGITGAATKVFCGSYHACALTTTGALYCWGSSFVGELGFASTDLCVGNYSCSKTAKNVSAMGSGVKSASCGWQHTCAINSAGALFCWGRGMDGRLGNGTENDYSQPAPVTGMTSGVVAVTCAEHHSCAVKDTGVAYCWGWNYHGLLGYGTVNQKYLSPGVVDVVPSTVVAIDSYDQTIALTSDGSLYVWGMYGGSGAVPMQLPW